MSELEVELAGLIPANGRPSPRLLLRHGRELVLRKDRTLVWQGEVPERCGLVLEGRMLPVVHDSQGKTSSLPAAGRGDWAALAELRLGQVAPCDWLALGECRIMAFSRHGLEALATLEGGEAWLAGALARSWLRLAAWSGEGGAEDRLCTWLLSRRRGPGGLERQVLCHTQAELATLLGLSRETVNRHLAALESQRILECGRGEIRILDWNGLAGKL